jgi:hypothetical protein
VLVDEFYGVVAEQVRGIAFLLNRFIIAVPVQHAVLLVGEIINLADQRAVW